MDAVKRNLRRATFGRLLFQPLALQTRRQTQSMSDQEGSPPPPAAGPKPDWLRVLVFGRRPRRTLWRIAVLVLTAIVVFKFVLMPVRIQGVSMFPAFKEGEIHCVYRLAYLRREPQRFDVVALRPFEGAPILLKRIVGLPGETVSIRRGTIHINGRPLEEPHVRGRGKWDEHEVRLGADQYLVIGDNRAMEPALHSHGSAERRMIVGRVWF